jgi:hypothetical protein
VTVQYKGFDWRRRLAYRCQMQVFRRVTKVYLGGREFKSNLLSELSKFHELRELELYHVAIPDSDLEAWKQQHPRVSVKVTKPPTCIW